MAIGLIVGIASSAIAVAAPTLTHEERQGEAVAKSLRAGERSCSSLSPDEFELIGEYAMGSYLGNGKVHAGMNRRMTLTMGEAGERRIHTALGYRYSGCPGGPASGWVGTMAGMMGSGYEGGDSHSGAMMGLGHYGTGDVSPLAAVLIALGAAALGVGVAALLLRRRRPHGAEVP